MRTHCKHGHPWVPENIYTCPRGHLICRTCQRMHNAKRKEIKKHPERFIYKPKIKVRAICSKGHRMTPENTYINPRGYGVCKACKKILDKNRRKSTYERIKRRKLAPGSGQYAARITIGRGYAWI